MASKIVSEFVSIFSFVFWLFSWFRTFVASWKSWKSIGNMGWSWTSAFSVYTNRQYKNNPKKRLEINQKSEQKVRKKRSEIRLAIDALKKTIFIDFWGPLGYQNGVPNHSKIDTKMRFEPWNALRTDLDTILGAFGDHFGSIWAQLGPIWVPFWKHWGWFGTMLGPFREHGRPSGSIFGPLEIKIAVITEQSVRSVSKLRESAFRILRFISKPLFAPE